MVERHQQQSHDLVSQPSAVVVSRESDDYSQGITNSAQSSQSRANMSRKDCCLNFFKNGFRRHPSCMPSLSEAHISTSLETRKQGSCHNRDNSNLEMFMQAADSTSKQKAQVKDEFELQFDVSSAPEDGRHIRSRAERMSAQAAYETNSSIGSENCSIDSIQVGLEVPGGQQATQQHGRASFWRHFFRWSSKPTNPSKLLQNAIEEDGSRTQTNLEDMHTIQERTETSEQLETQNSARMSSRLLDFIRKPFQLQMRKSSRRHLHGQNTGSVWALQMKETEAGRVMNFKVVMRRETKPHDIRYLEQFNDSNVFLLKYFDYSCKLCERLTSQIWTCSNCEQCKSLFQTRMEAQGICLDCCTQIQGLLSEKLEELSSCPLCAEPIEQGMVFVVEEPQDQQLKQVLQAACKDRITRLVRQMRENNGETVLLQTGEKIKLQSTVKKQSHKPLESSDLKPKKLEFACSPSRQFSLLESDRKLPQEDAGRFSLALQVCMTPREQEEELEASCEVTSEQANENYAGEIRKERRNLDAGINGEDVEDISDGVMTFDVEVDSNQNKAFNNATMDSRRPIESDIAPLDSRRSLSEILNEGNLNNVQLLQQPQHNQLANQEKANNRRPAQLKANMIDTIMEDDKENNLSSTVQGESEKDAKSSSCSTYRKHNGKAKSLGGAFSEITTFSSGNNNVAAE